MRKFQIFVEIVVYEIDLQSVGSPTGHIKRTIEIKVKFGK